MILDASAFLAYLWDEPGAEAVDAAIADRASISAVNLAEVLSRMADRGKVPKRVLEALTEQGLIDGALEVEPFTADDAVETARLRPLTREAGLSLGDRACLALAGRAAVTVLTADRAWDGLGLDVDVRQIR